MSAETGVESSLEQALAVTQDLPSLDGSGRDDARRIRLVEGSGPAMSVETNQVLRSRLRAAAAVLCVGFVIFFVWNVLHSTMTPANIRLLIAQALVIAALGVCGGLSSRGRDVSSAILRVEEAVTFGLPTAYLVSYQVGVMIRHAETYRVLPDITPPWLILLFTYALFIPNSTRRAIAALTVIGLVPVLMITALFVANSEFRGASNADVFYYSQEALIMTVAVAIAATGVHTIGQLRREAFEARRIGQYRLGGLLGQGGMGEVYLAEHQLMKRPCAIKLIRPEKAVDPHVLARFEQEVRATSKLSHWNSIEIYDYGRADDGTFYYVMEYLPGMNLNELVARHGPLPPGRAVHLLRQTCDALAEAHSMGLVHRDIKPHNIFAAQRGGVFDVAKLLDFGLVKPASSSLDVEPTRDHVVTGSPLYLSPEQATGDRPPDARSDIYSLGAVAYLLLTGKPPFEESKPVKLLIAHAHHPVRPPSELTPQTPADLEAVVLKCLAKRPEDRYQTAVELAEALDRCQSAGEWTAEIAREWWAGLRD